MRFEIVIWNTECNLTCFNNKGLIENDRCCDVCQVDLFNVSVKRKSNILRLLFDSGKENQEKVHITKR